MRGALLFSWNLQENRAELEGPSNSPEPCPASPTLSLQGTVLHLE